MANYQFWKMSKETREAAQKAKAPEPTPVKKPAKKKAPKKGKPRRGR